MKPEHQTGVLRRLRIARGHLDGVIRMVEQSAYCPDVMKQLAAIQGSVEGANRLVLRNHLETCVAEAVREGRTVDVVDELMEALRFDPGPATDPPAAVSARTAPAAGPTAANPSEGGCC